MALSDLYNRLLSLWGTTIHFADGAVLEHKNPFLALGKLKGQENPSAAKMHFYSAEFSKAWQQAEKQIGEDQLLEKQLLWAMYQVFQRHAQALYEKQVFSFSPSEINAALVEAQLHKNLQEPGYETELDLYRKLPS